MDARSTQSRGNRERSTGAVHGAATHQDARAQGLGERLCARVVDVPEGLLA